MRLFGKVGSNQTKAAKIEGNQPKTGIPEFDGRPELFKLIAGTLDQACGQLASTGLQTPFSVIETPEGQFVQDYDFDRLELGYEEARRDMLKAPPEAVRYSLAWAGYTTLHGVRYETVMVQGGERGMPNAMLMGQRYKQQLPAVKFQPIGNPGIYGKTENLLTLSGDPAAASKLQVVFQRIVADVDHNQSTGSSTALTYEFRKCQELILAFGDLDLPFRAELQKKPDMIHVIMKNRAWATIFKPESNEVFLARDTLMPIQGGEAFPGFKEDGAILMGYMPPLQTRSDSKTPSLFVLWAAAFKVSD